MSERFDTERLQRELDAARSETARARAECHAELQTGWQPPGSVRRVDFRHADDPAEQIADDPALGTLDERRALMRRIAPGAAAALDEERRDAAARVARTDGAPRSEHFDFARAVAENAGLRTLIELDNRHGLQNTRLDANGYRYDGGGNPYYADGTPVGGVNHFAALGASRRDAAIDADMRAEAARMARGEPSEREKAHDEFVRRQRTQYRSSYYDAEADYEIGQASLRRGF